MKTIIFMLMAFTTGLLDIPLKGQMLEITRPHIGLFTDKLQTKEIIFKTILHDQGSKLVEFPVKTKTKGIDISSISMLTSESSFSVQGGWDIRNGQAFIKLLFKPLGEGEIRDTLRVYYGNPAAFTSSYFLKGFGGTDKDILPQNYPNPFASSTIISFQIDQQSQVTLGVYDLMGKLVDTILENESMKPGKYDYQFDGTSHPAGTYLYKLMLNNRILQAKKMVLRK